MDPAEYAKAVEAQRREKDDFFKHSHHSPVPEAERAAFTGLRYFEPSAKHRVHGKWLPETQGEVLRVGASDGAQREYKRAGRIAFELEGREVTLAAFTSAGGHDNHLFVPFRDATSGKETYGAGRYLDLHRPQGDEIVVDFNLAYNPSCAYDEAYSCPLPPPENWLEVPVRAGEKTHKPS